MPEDIYKPLLMGYLDSELTAIEVLRMEQHLEQCPNAGENSRSFGS